MIGPELPSAMDFAAVTLPPERWEEYRDLRLAALAAEPTAFGEPYASAVRRTPNEWRGRLTDPTNWLVFAEHDGRLVGMAGAFADPDESGVINVVGVYVDHDRRGCGVGRRLLGALFDAVADRFPDGDAETVVLRLWVKDTNGPAIGLYASLDFAVVGVQRDALEHDGRTYDELIMERPLRSRRG